MAKPRRKKSLLIPTLLLIVLLLSALVGWMVYTLWGDSRQVFHDATIELGQDSLTVEDFLTPEGNPDRAAILTRQVDLSRVGKTSLVLKHGVKTYVVGLTIEDTTPPKADFLPEYTVSLSAGLPQAGALVENTEDYSPVRVYYLTEPIIPADYSDLPVGICVEDTSGNKTQGQCLLHFTGWLKEQCTLELGSSLTPDMLLLDPQRDAALLEESRLKEYGTSLGEFPFTAGYAERCNITVVDTTAPNLTVQSVRTFPGKPVSLTDFIVSATDISGDPEVRLVEDLPDFSKQGTYTISIEAVDSSGNVTRQESTLWVSKNLSPPVIQGAWSDITVKVGKPYDFLAGVTAKDDIDPKCEVAVDTSQLNLSKPGTYYITYSSIDSSGNVGTCKRKVIVME